MEGREGKEVLLQPWASPASGPRAPSLPPVPIPGTQLLLALPTTIFWPDHFVSSRCPTGTCYLRARVAPGGGAFARCQALRFRPLALAAAMLQGPSFLPLLLLLAMPALAPAWSRPLWYQVGLDLQPWGCQPDSLEGCKGALGCPNYWVGLGMGDHIYPVAGVTLTTTMMLVISRAMRQRRRSLAKSEQLQMTTDPCRPWKRRAPLSDRTLLLGVLHMLDALLVHIEGHLQRLATQQQIKGTPA
ncbi:transmembrane protein 89 [Choloepus didactylus]|uniref:transmembrane protein 89 n=1 Tax=Choloepus didactylus TaxID=27675 RepID=UPI00189C7039|nr:transmembrane protein 89 [Choloepus didactylus]